MCTDDSSELTARGLYAHLETSAVQRAAPLPLCCRYNSRVRERERETNIYMASVAGGSRVTRVYVYILVQYFTFF